MNSIFTLLLALTTTFGLGGAVPNPASATVSSATLSPAGSAIEWAESFDGAFTSAVKEGQVVFVAVNMDGERANDRMVEDVYGDKRIVALSERTVNLIASASEHKASGTCRRFGCSSCRQHQLVDVSVREHILKPDASGGVVAPQHVFLAPDGSVILSAPYEISSAELEWCFLTALAIFEDGGSKKRIEQGRRPRRLIMGDVLDLGGGLGPVTRDEALELIRAHKKGAGGGDAKAMLLRLVTADEPEALDYALTTLRAGGGGGRGGRGGGGGGGNMEKTRAELIRWIGVASPQTYWEICAEFVDSGSEEVQLEAAVALEQLAAREALPMLTKALRRASTEAQEKNIVRAIGACAQDDKKGRAAVLRASNDTKSPTIRANALLALGWLDQADEVDERLQAAALPAEHGGAKTKMKDVTSEERLGAVVAMGLTRGERWRELLEGLIEDQDEPEALRAAAQASLDVVGGAHYSKLKAALTEAGSDEIPRERLFKKKRRD